MWAVFEESSQTGPSRYTFRKPRLSAPSAVCYVFSMVCPAKYRWLALVSVTIAAAFSAENRKWLSPITTEHRNALAKRLDNYVKACSSQDWAKLFGLISDAARGGSAHDTFVATMKATHRKDFSNHPDLMEFTPERTAKAERGEYDIYGCGKARREGHEFNGVALIHVVFEHNDWFFSGWSFTDFPNEPCKALSDPSWELPGPMEWNKPMEELRNPGNQFHIDAPRK